MRGIKGFFAFAVLVLLTFWNAPAALANDWCPVFQGWMTSCWNVATYEATPGYIISGCHVDYTNNQPPQRIVYAIGWSIYSSDAGQTFTTAPGYEFDCYYNQIPGGNPAAQPLNLPLNNGQPICCNSIGDPINVGTGNVFRREDDFVVGRWLKFSRYYNSSNSVTNDVIGNHWRHTYSRNIQYAAGSNPTVTTNQEDGRSITWIETGTNPITWGTTPNIGDDLTETVDSNGNPTGWTLYRGKLKSYEQYNASGQLVAIQDLGGFTTTLQYSTAQTPTSIAPAPGLLISVTDAGGRAVAFVYNGTSQLAQVSLPNGETYSYGYDSSGNLTLVTFPDGSTRNYLYNEPAELNGSTGTSLLTGIMDESGNRLETYSYDSNNRAVSNQQPGGVGAISVTYGNSNTATVIDALGNSTVRSIGLMDGVAQVVGNSGPCVGCARVSVYNRDYSGNVTSSTDFNGVTKTFSYDFDNDQTTRVEASGTPSQRTYSQAWNETLHLRTQWSVVDANNNLLAQTNWAYNASGEPTAQCSYDATVKSAWNYTCGGSTHAVAGVRQWTRTYCATIGSGCPIVGLLLTTIGPRTDVAQSTTYTYYANGDLQSLTDAMGHTTTITSYDNDGRIKTLQDPNGVITSLNYTPRGWLTSATVSGATTIYTYTPWGAIKTITDADGIETTYGYDPAHRLNRITDALGNYIQYTLDMAGDKTAEQVYDNTGTLRKALTRTYNALGELTTITDGLGNTVFNATGSGSYDGNGNLVQNTDGFGTIRQMNYDALDRLTQTLDNYNGSDTATQNTKTIYSYDNLSRLSQITDPNGLNTTYNHDGLGDTTSQISPDTGSTTRTYDAAGNVLTSTDARGITATNTYDALNRVRTTSYSDVSQNITYSYDDQNGTTGCTDSYPVGRLTRIIESAVTTVYCYDARGNVTEKQQITSAGSDITTYSVSAAGRISAITYPSGTYVSYARDADGRIQSVSVAPPGGAANTAVSSVTYLPFGPISGYTLGNGQTVSRSYDANYRLTDLVSPTFSLHLARDVMGNPIALGNSPGANPAVETYSYDPLYRLTNVTESTGTSLETITYNQAGDRLTKTGTGLATGAYGYNPNTHQLVSVGGSTRTIDADGNTTAVTGASGTFGLGYSARNRLTILQLAGSTIGTYTYNALGQRIQKLVGGVSDRFDYNEQGQIIGDYGSTSRDYVWVDGLPVANVDSTGVTATITYVTADQLNTPRVITNAGGSAIWQWSYQGNPWGEVAPTAAGYTYNLQYPGQYFDAESGLNNNYFRDYDPTVGRYAQSDPSGLSGGMNTYAYVGNSPLSATDPRGLDDTICMFNPSFCGMSTAPSNPNLSAQNNPDLQGNLATGAEVGLATGAVAGGLVVANVIGFPEVEIGEAAAVAIGGEGVLSLEIMDALAGEPIGSIAVGAISGTGAGAIMGGAGGYMATRATAPPTPPTSSTSAQHGPYDTGDCP